jgi:hypothetical protein
VGPQRAALLSRLEVHTVEDLDAAVERAGDRIGRAKPAVQRGRSIATFSKDAALGVPVALMSPSPARGAR